MGMRLDCQREGRLVASTCLHSETLPYGEGGAGSREQAEGLRTQANDDKDLGVVRETSQGSLRPYRQERSHHLAKS